MHTMIDVDKEEQAADICRTWPIATLGAMPIRSDGHQRSQDVLYSRAPQSVKLILFSAPHTPLSHVADRSAMYRAKWVAC